MKIIKRLKAKLLRQTPLDDDQLLLIYMHAAKHMKPAPLFAKDFARLVEEHHGIVASHKVEPMRYGD
tara:strand:- start:143 stop:343 length:201 start_codon:yes stop_codon:yes gene_type:complete